MAEYNNYMIDDPGKINVVLSFERDFSFDEFVSVMETVNSSVKQAISKGKDIERKDYYISDYKSGSFDFNIVFGAVSAVAAVGSLAVSIVALLKEKFSKKKELGEVEVYFLNSSIGIRIHNGTIDPPALIAKKENTDYFDLLQEEYKAVTVESVNRICNIWMTDSRFENNRLQKQIALELIHEYPQNIDKEVVFKKVSLINAYYSTNLKEGMNLFYDDENMVNNILGIDFDNLVAQGDISVIDSIATVKSNISRKGTKEAISFASKYCFLHNIIGYPIYDSISVNVMKKLNSIHSFSERSVGITNNYTKYKAFYDDFNSFFFDGTLDYERIDCYLWTLGKIIEIHSKDQRFKSDMFIH